MCSVVSALCMVFSLFYVLTADSTDSPTRKRFTTDVIMVRCECEKKDPFEVEQLEVVDRLREKGF